MGGRRLTAGLDIYNVTNSNTILFYNTTYVPNVTGWQTPLAYTESARLPSRRRVRVVNNDGEC